MGSRPPSSSPSDPAVLSRRCNTRSRRTRLHVPELIRTKTWLPRAGWVLPGSARLVPETGATGYGKLLSHGGAGLERVIARPLHRDRLDGGNVELHLLIEIRDSRRAGLEAGDFRRGSTGRTAAGPVDPGDVLDVRLEPAKRRLNQSHTLLLRIQMSLAGNTGSCE